MTTVVPAGALLTGVDILDVPRVADLLGRYGRTLVERVSTPAEAEWVGEPPLAARLAALLALKEATIKTLGGRPAGFSWQTVAVSPRGVAPTGVPADVDGVLTAFAAGVGLDPGTAVRVGCAVTGVSLRCAAGRLAAGTVRGLGCYGQDGDRVLAAAVLWSEDRHGADDEHGADSEHGGGGRP